MSWKYYYIIMRQTDGPRSGSEFAIIRYADNLRNSLDYAYKGVQGVEPILAREADEFEIEGYHRGAFKM